MPIVASCSACNSVVSAGPWFEQPKHPHLLHQALELPQLARVQLPLRLDRVTLQRLALGHLGQVVPASRRRMMWNRAAAAALRQAATRAHCLEPTSGSTNGNCNYSTHLLQQGALLCQLRLTRGQRLGQAVHLQRGAAAGGHFFEVNW